MNSFLHELSLTVRVEIYIIIQIYPLRDKYLNQQRITMNKDATTTGEPVTVDFAGQMVFVQENAPGKVSISFDEMGRNLRHQIKDLYLEKINFKTVLAALKNTHPQIISAKLQLNEEQKYELAVVVAYQFLPEVKEVLVFESRAIPKEQTEQAAVRNIKSQLKGMRDQLVAMGNLQTISGNLEQAGDTEIFVQLSSKKAVFTLSLNLNNLAANLLKAQMFYYSSVTKQRKSSSALPEQGVYLNHNGNAFTQIKFLAEYEDFDMVIFKIFGKHKGDYILSVERVETLQIK